MDKKAMTFTATSKHSLQKKKRPWLWCEACSGYYYIIQLSVAKPNPSIFSFSLLRVLCAVWAYPETNYWEELLMTYWSKKVCIFGIVCAHMV